MQSEDINRPRQQSPRGKQARALTRAIDMVSEEFIENFSQTGVDEGPEKNSRLGSPSAELHSRKVLEARAARELREAQEDKDSDAVKAEFVGFASLLTKAKKTSRESAFSRLLDDSNDNTNSNTKANAVIENYGDKSDGDKSDANQSTETSFKPGTETTADGSIIRVKEAGKKKRGLYTSCMQKPSVDQIEFAGAAAVQDGQLVEHREVEVGIIKPSAAQIEAAILQAAEANAARAVALEQKTAEAQDISCCPMMNAFGPIVSLWRKLTSWTKTKAS